MIEMAAKFIDLAFKEDPTVRELLILALSFSLLWFLFFTVGTAIISPLVLGKPWLVARCERDYQRDGKKMCETFGTPMSQEEYVKTNQTTWVWLQLVLLQHFLGGMLCAPSLLGWFDDSTASSLACLGIISEMGWEIQDLITLFWKRFFTNDGKTKVPDYMLIIMPMHHSLTTTLAIPTILRYRNLRTLHWLCFDLQVASAVCLGVAEYTKLLDVTKKRDLDQFRVLTFFALVIAIWCRGIHWVYLLFDFSMIWFEEKAWMFLGVGLFMGLVFSAFSWFLCIVPFFQRFLKFAKISNEYTSLTASASAATRRQSMLRLSEAALDLTDAVDAGDVWTLNFFEERKVDRRLSMPFTMLASRGRRQSHILIRASMPPSFKLNAKLVEELEKEE